MPPLLNFIMRRLQLLLPGLDFNISGYSSCELELLLLFQLQEEDYIIGSMLTGLMLTWISSALLPLFLTTQSAAVSSNVNIKRLLIWFWFVLINLSLCTGIGGHIFLSPMSSPMFKMSPRARYICLLCWWQIVFVGAQAVTVTRDPSSSRIILTKL